MNQALWSVSINGDQIEESQFNSNSKKYQINDTNLVEMVMENIQNKSKNIRDDHWKRKEDLQKKQKKMRCKREENNQIFIC